MKKLFKFFSITGILSVLLVANVFAVPSGIEAKVYNWSKNLFGQWSVAGVKNKIIYDTDYDGYYYINQNGYMQTNLIHQKGFYQASNGCIIVDKNGKGSITGWGLDGEFWKFIKDCKLQKNVFIDSSDKVYAISSYPSGKTCYYVNEQGIIETNSVKPKKIGNNYYSFDANGICTQTQGGMIFKKSGWVNDILYDSNQNIAKNVWTNLDGSDIGSYTKGIRYYRTDENGKMIKDHIFKVGSNYYKAESYGACFPSTKEEYEKFINQNNKNKQQETPKQDDKSSNEKKEQNLESTGLHTKIKNYINKNGTPEGSTWVNLGGGDWGIVINGQWKTQWWDNVNNSNNWYYTGQDGLMLRSVTAYAKDKGFNKLTSKESEAYKVNGIALKCYFDNNGIWKMKLDDKNGTYSPEDEKEMNNLPPSEVASFLSKQEKKDIKNKKDEDVENEIAIPIEIYTKDQFYKGKFSTGQISENEYLTNGYYIYNKGNGKYTLYKANDTIGKTSKAIKSNTTLAKITDYLDDNDIEKSAEIKAKEGSSSSKDKSSSKTSKKITVTIKSGYKTKDKQSVEIDYEGSYTLPTFEKMNWEEKPKYTFSHWAIGSKKYNPGDTIDNIKSKKTITAKWKKN